MGCDEAQGFLFSRPMEPDILFQRIEELEAHARATLTAAGLWRPGSISSSR